MIKELREIFSKKALVGQEHINQFWNIENHYKKLSEPKRDTIITALHDLLYDTAYINTQIIMFTFCSPTISGDLLTHKKKHEKENGFSTPFIGLHVIALIAEQLKTIEDMSLGFDVFIQQKEGNNRSSYSYVQNILPLLLYIASFEPKADPKRVYTNLRQFIVGNFTSLEVLRECLKSDKLHLLGIEKATVLNSLLLDTLKKILASNENPFLSKELKFVGRGIEQMHSYLGDVEREFLKIETIRNLLDSAIQRGAGFRYQFFSIRSENTQKFYNELDAIFNALDTFSDQQRPIKSSLALA